MNKISNVYGTKEWVITAGLFTLTLTILGLVDVLGWRMLLVMTMVFFSYPYLLQSLFGEEKRKGVFWRSVVYD